MQIIINSISLGHHNKKKSWINLATAFSLGQSLSEKDFPWGKNRVISLISYRILTWICGSKTNGIHLLTVFFFFKFLNHFRKTIKWGWVYHSSVSPDNHPHHILGSKSVWQIGPQSRNSCNYLKFVFNLSLIISEILYYCYNKTDCLK